MIIVFLFLVLFFAVLLSQLIQAWHHMKAVFEKTWGILWK